MSTDREDSGDRRHPYTRGALCAKVARVLDATRSAERLLHPQRRIGRRGEGRFTRIPWDEALDEVASRWRAVISGHGAHDNRVEVVRQP